MVSDKPYHQMTEDELRAAFDTWRLHVENAAGWPSAYFAASQLAAICKFGGFENPYPVRRGP